MESQPASARTRSTTSFELLEALGSGSSGTVYRARLAEAAFGLPAGTIVAVKRVRDDLVAEADARERLIAEGRLGMTVSSPHVVRIFTVESTRDASWLVMEFVAGRTLRRVLDERGPLIGELVRRIGQHAATGLGALHAIGAVHRDVKPENLIVTTDFEVKLMDLDLARRADERLASEEHGAFHGSVAYAAPELLRGQRATPASDLYSLGVVLYEVVTGRHPFAEARTTDEMLRAHLHDVPVRASHHQPNVSAFLEQILVDLLQKEPALRPGDALELAATLAAGSDSAYWRWQERRRPALASERRLHALRRARHTPFVPRRPEQRVLERRLREMLRGRGVALQVTGPTGSGRRRLLDETIARWIERHDDLVFLGGVADGRPTAAPESPFPEILVDWFLHGEDRTAPHLRARLAARIGEESPFARADAERLAAILANDGGGLPAASPTEDEALQRIDLVARAIEHVVRARPGVVLRVDHAERLAPVARAVVERLAESARDLRLLLLLVGERAQPIVGPELAIGGLEPAQYRQLARLLFRRRHAPLDLVDAAWAPLSGLPGALIESLEDLAQRGLLRGRPGDFHALDPGLTELRPARPTLARLREQIEALPATTRAVIRAAAVLGQRFPVADVAALTGRPELEVLEAFGALDNRIVRAENGVGRFRHRDYLLATIAAMPTDVLRMLHRDAASLLERRGGSPLEVGMHLSRAMEHAAALDPLLAGLSSLEQSGATTAAMRVARRIRLHLDQVADDPRHRAARLRLLLSLAAVLARLERVDRAERRYREANVLAERLGDRLAKARALVGLADLAQRRSRFFATVQLLAGVEELLGAMPREPAAAALLARALMVHGRVMAYQGQTRAALGHVATALRLVPSGEPLLRAHLYIDDARWRAVRLDFTGALASLDRAADLVGSTPDGHDNLRLHLHRGRVLGFLGDREAAGEDLGSAEVLARRFAETYMIGRVCLVRAELDVFAGEREAAEPRLREALVAAGAAGDRVTEQLAAALLHAITEDPTGPQHDEVPLALPVVEITWLLSRAVRASRDGDATAARHHLARALQLERTARVHLLLRLALLRTAGRERSAERVVRTVARQLPAGSPRRRFLQFSERIGLP